jgi:7-cyano-7-deazaguanine synthase
MKSIVIHSGGLDSTVLLCALLHDGREVQALSIDYGQRHRRELNAAGRICKELKVRHQVADLSGLRPLLGGSSQTDNSVAVPTGHYAEENMKLTVVPNRNAILLSTAVAWAISLKYDSVAYAAHAGDHAIYPDCREEFCAPFAEAMRNADWHKVELERPFLQWTKGDIAAEGMRLGAPLGLTYSCYTGNVVHCGKCGTCTERRMAFIEAGAVDPTVYQTPLEERYIKEAQQANVARAKRVVA